MKTKLNKRKILKSLGDRLSFAVVINFYIWLFVAMTQGDKVMIYFNHFGEALIEYIIYLIIFPIMLYALWCDIRDFRRKRHEKK